MRRNPLQQTVAYALVAVSIIATLAGGSASAARWGENYFPNLPVVTHEGKTVRFYDDLIRGKIVVINFVYVTCPDLCSLSTARLAQVREWLGERVGRDIFIYTMTIDPQNDTPDLLKTFAEGFGAGDGWLFLTGKPEDIHTLRWKLGERSRTLSEHRSDMVLGSDKTGYWRRISAMGNLKIVTQRILEMDPAFSKRKRVVSGESLEKTRDDYRVENHRGEALYLKACSFCHTIGRGARFGPDLKGVTTRREHDWLVRYLRAPKLMRDEKDPIAVKLDAEYPGVTMPYLGLSEADAEDVIAYLEATTRRVTAAEGAAGGQTGDGHHDHNHHDHHHHDGKKQPSSSENAMEGNP